MPNQETQSIAFEHNKHLIVKTWNEILGIVKIHLEQGNERILISDIDQIIGFCDTIDSNAFLPIQSDDLSPKYARRINSYYDLIDKVVDELKKRKIANTNGLNATGQRWGYTRYLQTDNIAVSLCVQFDYWAAHADTPFWITFKELTPEKKWPKTSGIIKECKTVASQLGSTIHESNTREVFFALFPVLDKTEDIVINDLAEQIIQLTTSLEIKMGISETHHPASLV